MSCKHKSSKHVIFGRISATRAAMNEERVFINDPYPPIRSDQWVLARIYATRNGRRTVLGAITVRFALYSLPCILYSRSGVVASRPPKITQSLITRTRLVAQSLAAGGRIVTSQCR